MSSEHVGTARTILRNAFALFLVGAFDKGAGLIIAILVARFLGPDSMGLFALLFSVAMLVQIVVSLGMSDSLVRDVAARREEAGTLYRAALRTSLLASLVPAAGLALAAFLVDESRGATPSLAVLAFGTPVSAAFVVSQSTLQGTERVVFLTWVSFVARLLSLVLLAVALYAGAGLEAAFASRVFAHLASLAAYTPVLRREQRSSAAPQSARALVVQSVPFLFNKLIRELSVRIPAMVLPVSAGLAPSGIFDAANRVRSTLGMVMQASIVGMMPAFARSVGPQAQGNAGLIGFSAKYMCLAMSAMATVIVILADWIVALLFGPAFREASLLLQILVWGQVLVSLDAVLQQAMLAAGNTLAAVRHSAVGVIAQLALIVALWPALGLPGVALAVVLSTVLALALDLWFVSRRMISFRVVHFVIVPMCAALMVGGTLLAWASAGWAVRIALAVAAWAVAIFVLRVLPRQELQFMMQMLDPRQARRTGAP